MSPLTAAHEESMVVDQLERRRRAAAEAWSLESGQAVVIGAGTPLPVPGRGDRTYPFYAHSEYLYLTDRERPGAVLAFDPADGWFDFVPHPTAEQLLWSGAPAAELGISAGDREPRRARPRGRVRRRSRIRRALCTEPDTAGQRRA